MVITCGIAIVELAVNMAVTGLGCTGRSSYNANVDDMQKALELAKEDAADNNVPFYRVEDTGRLTKNDGTEKYRKVQSKLQEYTAQQSVYSVHEWKNCRA